LAQALLVRPCRSYCEQWSVVLHRILHCFKMAMEQPKKITGGAFGRFMHENRAALLKECAGKPATASIKLGSERFKALGDMEKTRYQNIYETAVADYNVAVEKFKAGGGEFAAKKSKKGAREEKNAKKASNLKNKDAPKKPSGGGYGRFLGEKRNEIRALLPAGHNPITDVAKKAGEMFKALGEADRKKYDDMFKEAMQAYKKAMAEFKDANPDVEEATESSLVKAVSEATPPKGQKRVKPDSPVKPAGGAGKRGGPAGGKAPAAAVVGVALDETVLSEATNFGFSTQLKNLASRTDVISSGKKGADLLAALQTSGGLVNPAKQALLGA